MCARVTVWKLIVESIYIWTRWSWNLEAILELSWR